MLTMNSFKFRDWLVVGLLASGALMAQTAAPAPATSAPAAPVAPPKMSGYFVEVLSFAHAGGDPRSYKPAGLPDVSSAVVLQSAETIAAPDEALPNATPPAYRERTDFRLGSAANKLSSAGGYRLVSQQRWFQPLNGRPVRIGSAPLQGRVTVTGSVEPNVAIDLGFAPDSANPSTVLRLTTSQSLKLAQAHYFDHRTFGAVVVVSGYFPPAVPVTPPAPTTP
jgi:hypothetical protein